MDESTPVTRAEDFTEDSVRDAPVRVEEGPYDPGKDRELMRGRLAVLLLGLLCAVVVGAFLTLWLEWATLDDLETLLTLVFAPLIALVGTVIGFYFGSKSA